MKNQDHVEQVGKYTLYPEGYNDGLLETTRVDIFTPGASTVAKFKTTILNLLDSIRLKQSVK